MTVTADHDVVARALARLHELRAEFAAAERQLAQVEQRRQQIQDGLLRLAGAIGALEELVAESGAFDPVPAGGDADR